MNAKNKTCSIRDLASYLELSTCTVSKVLNGHSDALRVPESTRERVLQAARELNYVPNINAKRLFERRSNVLGLLVPPQEDMGHNAFSDTHFVDILSGIEKQLSKVKYSLMLLFNREEYKENGRYHDMFRSGLIDGLLIWGVHRRDSYWNDLQELTGPRIFLTSTPDYSPDSRVNYIVSDYEQSAYEVTRHLLLSGARKFYWLAGKEDTSIIQMLKDGQQKALTEFALSPDAVICGYSDYTETDGEILLSEAMKKHSFDAILATAPQLARGAQRIIKQQNLSLKIGCFDGQAKTRQPDDIYYSALTNDTKIGEFAVSNLIELIENKNNESGIQIKIPVNFTATT